MEARAKLLGHPVHQMLIPFPFAFLTGAVLFFYKQAGGQGPDVGSVQIGTGITALADAGDLAELVHHFLG